MDSMNSAWFTKAGLYYYGLRTCDTVHFRFKQTPCLSVFWMVKQTYCNNSYQHFLMYGDPKLVKLISVTMTFFIHGRNKLPSKIDK